MCRCWTVEETVGRFRSKIKAETNKTTPLNRVRGSQFDKNSTRGVKGSATSNADKEKPLTTDILEAKTAAAAAVKAAIAENQL